MEGASAEELDEFLVRYNTQRHRVERRRLSKNFPRKSRSSSIETKLEMPWGKEEVTLYYGEVPMGESVELLVLRKGVARQLLPDGKVGAPLRSQLL